MNALFPDDNIFDDLDDESRDPHPRFARNLYGHQNIEEQLLSHYANDSMPGAYMLTGPRGIGKATLAYRFARFLLHQSDAKQEAAGGLFGDALPSAAPTNLDIPKVSDAARRIEVGSHSDMLVIEPAFDEKKNRYKTEISVEQIRKIGAFLSLTSAESDYKIVIIDPVDALNRNAANAMLKWLEEPPSDTIFFLVTHNAGAVLDTIRSRCRVIGIAAPEFEDFCRVITEGGLTIDEHVLNELYVLSSGSAGVASELYIAGAHQWYDDLLELLLPPRLDSAAAQKFSETAMRDDISWKNKSTMVLALLARIAKLAASPESVDHIRIVSPTEKRCIQRLSVKKPLDYWLDSWEKTASLSRDVEGLYLDKTRAMRDMINMLSST